MFQIHRKYLFSKINFIVIFFILLIAGGCYLSCVNLNFNVYEKWLNRKENYIIFYNTMFYLIKFIGVLLASFLMGTAFSSYLDNYAVLFLKKRKDRLNYFISKILVLNIMVFLILFVIGLLGIFILCISTHWYSNFYDLFKLIFYLISMALVYGNFSILLVLIFKTVFVSIIPFIIFVIIEIIDGKMFGQILTIIFPNFNVFNFSNLIQCVILSSFYSFISLIIYYHKDLT